MDAIEDLDRAWSKTLDGWKQEVLRGLGALIHPHTRCEQEEK